jgi:hypothetical protein
MPDNPKSNHQAPGLATSRLDLASAEHLKHVAERARARFKSADDAVAELSQKFAAHFGRSSAPKGPFG